MESVETIRTMTLPRAPLSYRALRVLFALADRNHAWGAHVYISARRVASDAGEEQRAAETILARLAKLGLAEWSKSDPRQCGSRRCYRVVWNGPLVDVYDYTPATPKQREI